MALPLHEGLLFAGWMIALACAAAGGYAILAHRESSRPLTMLRVGRYGVVVAMAGLVGQAIWALLIVLVDR
ncbi:hypothetical protein GA0070622_2832 [Micromonospora sediminicola]|uniref:Uncharacterized protein n=1 Tax=Micromonospora sediminicola TaxID=946078 RepID=A0A1A9BA16_9ACTN|nr:hypothetical protein [Micromonospora sediminicola]SBT65819.1 hypothetical protein GA0070622_2832 [Micromonospora sediminicola]